MPPPARRRAVALARDDRASGLSSACPKGARDARIGGRSLRDGYRSRFDLIYTLRMRSVWLRWRGCSPANKRYVVFQARPDTPGLVPELWRVFAKAHELRSRSEYEGAQDIEQVGIAEGFGVRQIINGINPRTAVQ